MDDRLIKSVLLIGASGSIGRRYEAILRWMSCDVTPYDIGSDSSLLTGKYDGILIASPTHTHHMYLEAFKNREAPTLVEKPMCASIEQARLVANYPVAAHLSVVDNWVHMLGEFRKDYFISYGNFYTGKEKLSFNLAQPIFLSSQSQASGFAIDVAAPCFVAEVEKPYEAARTVYTSSDIDHSYLSMLDMWTRTGKTNFSFKEGLEMQEAIAAWEDDI